jgi:hypothetical protein
MDHGPTLWSGPCIHDAHASPASPSTSLQDWCSLPKVAMSDFGCLSCCCHCPPCSTLHLCFLCSWAYSWLYSHSLEREKQRIRTFVSYIRYFNQLKYKKFGGKFRVLRWRSGPVNRSCSKVRGSTPYGYHSPFCLRTLVSILPGKIVT